jgi:hypothetical protein
MNNSAQTKLQEIFDKLKQKIEFKVVNNQLISQQFTIDLPQKQYNQEISKKVVDKK